ncbi:MAG: hypothetical protein ABL924_14975 [Methyloglobulus sp.]
MNTHRRAFVNVRVQQGTPRSPFKQSAPLMVMRYHQQPFKDTDTAITSLTFNTAKPR